MSKLYQTTKFCPFVSQILADTVKISTFMTFCSNVKIHSKK